MSTLGKNKYNVGDKVKFKIGEELKEGTVEIVDKWGTFYYPEDVCYDIMSTDEKYKSEINMLGECLYKHVKEEEIIVE